MTVIECDRSIDLDLLRGFLTEAATVANLLEFDRVLEEAEAKVGNG